MVTLMKYHFRIPFIVLVASVSCAHAQQQAVDAVGKWLSERTMSAALADDGPGAMPGIKEGAYRIVAIDNLDAPEEVKAHFMSQMGNKGQGVIRVPKGTIPSIAELLAVLPTAQRSAAVLRERLPSPPVTLRGTLLAGAEVIGMEPSGALDGVKSSGLTRYFRVDELGVVALNEENFRASGMTIEVFAESLNTTVNDTPAQLELHEDGHGRAQATLGWALDGKALRLTVTGDGDAAQKGEALRSIASGIVD